MLDGNGNYMYIAPSSANAFASYCIQKTETKRELPQFPAQIKVYLHLQPPTVLSMKEKFASPIFEHHSHPLLRLLLHQFPSSSLYYHPLLTSDILICKVSVILKKYFLIFFFGFFQSQTSISKVVLPQGQSQLTSQWLPNVLDST